MKGPENTSSANARRTLPSFFATVSARAKKRWEQLEGDAELAGPWKQLFAQVQSPRHVLSELLQNADDAGAKHTRAQIDGGSFIFEHDGEDFSEDQFASLCKFGFSNKRKLHTIGFRGIGFKSTFSLGDSVEVTSPSLAVRFGKQRFTEPLWIDDAEPLACTRVAVKLRDRNVEKELAKNLSEWSSSGASLLFFNSISELCIDSVSLRRHSLGKGPLKNSQRVRLTGCESSDLLVFRSDVEPFPDDAIEEIQQERDTNDLHLPPCRVEIVVGLPGSQRLYVVLPTGVPVGLPFSCNAPFLQEPSRAGIKPPSTSPTNRWLLRRLGRLAGEALLGWLHNTALPLKERAEAYCLFPGKYASADSLQADVESAICEGFAEVTDGKPILLTAKGSLADKDNCIAPPPVAYPIWSPGELLSVFGSGRKHVLAEPVSEQARARLESWEKLQRITSADLIVALTNAERVPRPATYAQLTRLWCFVYEHYQYDYGGSRRRLAIVPAQKQDRLFAVDDVVRLPARRDSLNDESWQFLAGLIHVIDGRWVEFLNKSAGQSDDAQAARQLLLSLGLDRASDVDQLAASACRRLFADAGVGMRDCVTMAHIIAGLGARTPDKFRCITRDSNPRQVSDEIVVPLDARAESLLPPDWAGSHVLNDAYSREFRACTRQQWQSWLASEKCLLLPFATPTEKPSRLWGRYSAEQFLRSRQATIPTSYHYKREHFSLCDFDFDDALLKHWAEGAINRPDMWARVGEAILRSPTWYWRDRTHAMLRESGNAYECDVNCGPIPAAWIMQFASLPCLPDTYGRAHLPSDLYLRTPETEPLMDAEPFVRADLDTEATKPLLRLLGVRDTPAGVDKLLGRIRALAEVEAPVALLQEIAKWHNALDKVILRCSQEDLDEVRSAFQSERLILTTSLEWTTASEVFQTAGEDDMPDAPTIHPSVRHLLMWARLGVADRPSIDHVLDWLGQLASETPLDSALAGRIRNALGRYPVQIWDACQHWLALDNSWAPIDSLKYRLTMGRLTRWSDLSPAVKARTADLRMLTANVCDTQPFTTLLDLGAVVEYRPTKSREGLSNPQDKPWAAALGRILQRARMSDESITRRVREAAERIQRSRWCTFESLSVTPYIDGTPAGQPHSPDVLWHEDTIYVRRGGIAKSFKAVADELARPFADAAVAEAIKACIERDEAFIAEYLEEHFTLEAEPTLPLPIRPGTPSAGDGQSGNGDKKGTGPVEVKPLPPEPPDEGVLEEAAGGEGGGVETPSPRPEPRQPSLFERFAISTGYRWDKVKQRFIHSDGSWMEKCDGSFHWHRVDSTGNVTTRYWTSQQCLDRTSVEIAADAWEVIRSSPSGYCLVLVDAENEPLELPGEELMRMVTSGQIVLYPAKYRMRMEAHE